MSFKKAAYLLPFTLLALNTAFAVPLIISDIGNSQGISMRPVGANASFCVFRPNTNIDKGYLNNIFIIGRLEKASKIFIMNQSKPDNSVLIEKEIKWSSDANLTISEADSIAVKAPIIAENGSLDLSSQNVDIDSIDNLKCKMTVIKSNNITIKGEKASKEDLELLKAKNVTIKPF